MGLYRKNITLNENCLPEKWQAIFVMEVEIESNSKNYKEF